MRLFFYSFIMMLLPGLAQLSTDTSIIEVTNAWISESPPSVRVNAAYMLIKNTSDQDIVLNKVESPDFERVEMHRSKIREDTAHMELQGQLEITANSQLHFKPGDYHLMLFNPARSMRVGAMSTLILYLSGGRQIEVDVIVKKLNLEQSHKH
jgi:copper(I)-binding protein